MAEETNNLIDQVEETTSTETTEETKDQSFDPLGFMGETTFHLMHYPMSLLETHLSALKGMHMSVKARQWNSDEMKYAMRYAAVYGFTQLASIVLNTDLNNMIENETLDIVVLCTPSGLHAEQTEMCSKKGINIMTEKPMATRWNDGINMVKACDQAGVRLFVVKQNRNNPTIKLLKRAMRSKTANC